MNYSLVVNGFGNAFLQEFGCPCPRCARKEPVANVSVSIIGRDGNDREIRWHALVDVGLGVVDSLRNTFSPDEARVDWLLFTHWHPDHSLELNRLGETMRRTARRRGETFTRIPTWCRGGTGKWLSPGITPTSGTDASTAGPRRNRNRRGPSSTRSLSVPKGSRSRHYPCLTPGPTSTRRISRRPATTAPASSSGPNAGRRCCSGTWTTRTTGS